MGRLDCALHNYGGAVKALARRIVKNMENSRLNRIFKTKASRHNLWIEYAFYGAMYHCAVDGIDSMVWGSAEFIDEEERTEHHAGLYWVDHMLTL